MKLLYIFPILFIFSCSNNSYKLDFTSVEPYEFVDYIPSMDIAKMCASKTREKGIVFETSKENYDVGEVIEASIKNTSETIFEIAEYDQEFDFDKNIHWTSVRARTDYYLVSEQPKIAGKISLIKECYFVTFQFLFIDEDNTLFEPGEEINFEIALPKLTGKFQLEFYCVEQNDVGSWGLNRVGANANSNTFVVE